MADEYARIKVDVDTTAALANIKNLQRQISQFHTSMARGGADAATSSRLLQQKLVNNINATGQFSAGIKTVQTTTESFTSALESNKLSMGEYFKYSGGASKTFGKLFRSEFDTINKVARERVKSIQTQYVKLGRDAGGAMKAIAIRPLVLDMDNLATRTAIAAQRQQLLNQMLKQGSTNLLNFGKNTQWAGRQLMVGFTIPLAMFGALASKAFMDVEKQAIRFKRVYGDAFSTTLETDQALDSMKKLANEFTKYGIAVEKTLELSADAAQMGLKGAELIAQVSEATRLAALGEVEQQEALKTTVSVTNAFGIAASDLAKEIDFLNAVENETITAIEDLTIAIPKAGPVVKQLGGDVRDLAFFLTAMKEGGINASEGANALKSGLASMINPAQKTKDMLMQLGISIDSIVESNAGDIRGTVIGMANALDELDPLSRARAIEQLFGKFQFSRISTLFQNVVKEGSQASKVLDLASSSAAELAVISERELKRVEDSPMFKFQKALEDIKVSLVPLGEAFLKAVTPLIQFGTDILKRFNDLDASTKNLVVNFMGVAGIIGPVFLMTFGLIANGVANIIKGFVFVKTVFNRAGSSATLLGQNVDYMTQQQIEASAVAASLNQVHSKLIQTFTAEAGAINALTASLQRAVAAQATYSGVATVGRGARPKPGMKLASGILSVPGPKGAGDVVPAMLSPGEAVIPAKQSQKYSGIISSLISDNVPGFRFGRNPFGSMLGRTSVGVRMKSADFSSALANQGKNARYQSAFSTNTGADYKHRSGSDNPKQRLARSAMERDLFGLDPKTTPKSSRPTYGYARTSPLQAIFNTLFGAKGKRFNQVTRKPGSSLDIYGDLDLITKSSVAKRSTASVGDSLMDYVKTREAFASRRGVNYDSPMEPRMVEKFSQAAMRGKGGDFPRFDNRLGIPFGSRREPGTNTYSVNPKPAYVETLTPGGFAFKEIDRIISNNPAMVKQLRRELKIAGLGGIRVSGPGFAARLFKRMGVPGYTKGTASIDEFDPKTLKFGGQSYTRKTAAKALELKKVIETLQSNGVSDERIFARAQDLYSRDVLSPSRLTRNLGFTTKGVPKDTSQSGGQRTAITEKIKAAGVFNAEQKKLTAWMGSQNFVDKKGKPLTKAQIGNLVQVQLSHLDKISGQPKNWRDMRGIAPDLGGINNYMNTIEGKFGKNLLDIDNKTLKSYGIDRKELQSLVNGNHPITKKAAETFRAIAAYDIANQPPGPAKRSVYTAQFAQYAMGQRLDGNFYNRSLPSIQQLIDDGTIQHRANKNKSQVIDGSSGTRKSPKDKVLGGSVSDNKNMGGTAAKKGETFLNADSTKALKAGKNVTVPGVGRFRKSSPLSLLGADDGFPRGQFSDGTERVRKTESGQFRDRETKKRLAEKEAKRLMRLDKQNEQRREKSARLREANEKRIAGIQKDYNMSQKEFDKLSKKSQDKLRNERKRNLVLEKQEIAKAKELKLANEKKLADEKRSLAQKEERRVAKQEKVKARSGKVAGGLGAVAIAGGAVAAGIDPFMALIGGQMLYGPIKSLFVKLGANALKILGPIGLAASALAGIGIAFYNTRKAMDEAAKSSREMHEALGPSSSALQKIADFSGAATPGEIMTKMNASSGIVPIDQTGFGAAYLSSEDGQNLVNQVKKSVASGGVDEAVKLMTSQLATAVASGLITADEAKAISLALGQQLDDYGISLAINVQLNKILGPNGENLLDGGNIDVLVNLMGNTRGTALQELAGTAGEFVLNPFSDRQAEIAGLEAASASELSASLSMKQLVIDAFDAENLTLIQNLELQGKYKEAADAQATYDEKRAGLIEKTNEALKPQLDLLKELEGFEIEKASGLNIAIRTGTDQAKAAGIVNQFEETTKAKFENTDTKKIIENIASAGRLSADVKVNLMASFGDGISEDTWTKFSSYFDPKKDFKEYNLVSSISTKLDARSAGQAMDFVKYFSTDEAKTVFLATMDIRANDPKGAKKTLALIDSVIESGEAGIPGFDAEFRINAILNRDTQKKIDKEIEKFKKLAEDSADGKLTVDAIITQKVITDPYIMNQLRADQAWFESLDPKQQLEFFTILTQQRQFVSENEVDAYFAENPEARKYMSRDDVAEYLAYGAAKAAVDAGDDVDPDPDTDPPGGSGGTAKESPVKNLLEDLKRVNKASIDATGGVKELLRVLGDGKQMATFQGLEGKLIAKGATEEFTDFLLGMDPAARKEFMKIKKNGSLVFTEIGRAAQKAFNATTIGSYVVMQKRLVQEANNKKKAYDRLIKAGMKEEDALEAVEDATLAAAVAMLGYGNAGQKSLQKIVNWANKAKKAIEESKTPLEQLTDIYNGVTDQLQNQRNIIELEFELSIAADQSALAIAQAQIEKINSEISSYQSYLDEISRIEESINLKYDKRLEAVDQLQKKNERAVSLEKAKLTIADALSQGDIAAAARAIQDLRAEEAAGQVEDQRDLIEQQRQSELAAIAASNGMTKAAMEATILGLQQQILKIEKDSIIPITARIQLAEDEKNAKVAAINLQITEFDLLMAKAEDASAATVDYQVELEKARVILAKMVRLKAQLSGNTTVSGQPRASGGYISGPGTATSDSIPAMLSDGEYVIKAASVNKFGTGFMDSINAGQLPGFKAGGSVNTSSLAGILAASAKKPKVALTKAQIEANERAAAKKAKAKKNAAALLAEKKKDSAAVTSILKQKQTNKVFDTVLNIARKIPLLSGMAEGIDISKSLMNLFGGKAGGNDAMVLGLGALGMVPGGRAVSTGAKALKGIKQAKGIIPTPKGYSPSSPVGGKAESDKNVVESMGYNMQRYLGDANSLYSNPTRSAEVARFFQLGDEMLPGGLQMYRAPNANEVMNLLPRIPGAIYKPNSVRSAGTSGDLQQLGEIFTDKTLATGGNQHLAQGIAQIFTRKPIPGIQDLTKFLSTRKADARLPSQSQFMKEYILGPNTSYRVESFTPGTKNTPASWVLEAFIDTFAKGGLVKPSYFASGGMAKKYAMGGMVKLKNPEPAPTQLAGGGMVKPQYFAAGGMVKKYARGGDVVPSMLTPGEFVMNKYAVDSFGVDNLKAINSGAKGTSSMYNNTYSVNVNVVSDADPNEIAGAVMNKIKQIDSQRLRSNRFNG